VSKTVNIDHIKQGYYSIKALNPIGIVPLGPELSLPACAAGKKVPPALVA
jgi:putative glutathione S-transferase